MPNKDMEAFPRSDGKTIQNLEEGSTQSAAGPLPILIF